MKHQPSAPSSSSPQIGVICVNLGTPKSPQRQDVRKYLSEFLRDDRLITNPIIRTLVSTLLPWLRSPQSAAKYQRIWNQHPQINSQFSDYLKLIQPSPQLSRTALGSPLLYNSLLLTYKLQLALQRDHSYTNRFLVMLAMNLGEPSIHNTLKLFQARGITKLVVIPLFPQYASCTYGAALARIYHQTSRHQQVETLRTLPPFGLDSTYTQILATQLNDTLNSLSLSSTAKAGSTQTAQSFHVVISFHGLPLKSCLHSPLTISSHLQYQCGDPQGRCCEPLNEPALDPCYRRQCLKSAQQTAKACDLSPDQYTVSFQSKVGPEQWTSPYTMTVLTQLAEQNSHLRNIIIICPSFITDCLETLEEIHLEAKQHIESHYPHLKVTVIPCINEHPAFIQFLKTKIHQSCSDFIHQA